jgi:uncharacterized protein YndB with AHSA1/START domain
MPKKTTAIATGIHNYVSRSIFNWYFSSGAFIAYSIQSQESASNTIIYSTQTFMQLNNIPTVETQMLIRKPVAEVFQAFIDPSITTNFWFTKSSGLLEVGKIVTWQWAMYNVSIDVKVLAIEANKKIMTEWGTPATKVDYEFTSVSNDSTYVIIKNYGFTATGDDLINIIKDSTGGFTTVLDGLKAYLEFGIRLNLIADKFPKEVSVHGQ